jgi:hypothetical protein
MSLRREAKRAGPGVLGLAGSTVAVWWLWLGWDTEYQTDPVTGSASGPYEAWQVIGCVLSLGVIAVVGGLFLRPWIVVPTMTVPFTITWSWAAAVTDNSGLWAVGALLVFVGLASGSAGLSFGAWLIRARINAGGADTTAV